MELRTLYVFATALFIAVSAGCSSSDAPLTSPSHAVAGSPGAGPDGGRLKVTPPAPVWPAHGAEVEDDTPELVIDNARPRFSDSLSLSYVFEVLDGDNRVIYQSSPVPSGGDGRTSHEIGAALAFDSAFSWRAYAVAEGERGPMSRHAEFRTFNRYGPSCANLGSELAIVQCRRSQFGFMSEADRLEFLRRVAHDLNRVPAEHAPYGLLIKTSGHNCYGFSCDILCSNTGGVHRQWDVLSDENGAQAAVWSRVGRVEPRPCEIVR